MNNAKAALEQIPEIYFTKLTEMAYLLDGDSKFEAAEKQKWISFEHLLQMMWKLAECYECDGETQKAIDETEKILKPISIIENVRFNGYIDFFDEQLRKWNSKL